MPTPKPALITNTKLDNEATKDVKIKQGRRVTYVFKITTHENLKIPYAISVNDAIQDEFKNKTKRMPKDGVIFVSNITPGARVSLFLNSDAHPRYRKEPVYTVTPLAHDVIVYVLEKKGKYSDEAIPIQSKNNNDTPAAMQNQQAYTATLTGDIWMKVSHKYLPGEIYALLPPETSPFVKEAVLQIYGGLGQPSLKIALPVTGGGEAKSIVVKFEDGKNPHENISHGYDLLKEGLTRVHPAGYAAIFSAAVEAGVLSISMSSAWRPMYGSISHRAGLGLDVNYIGSIHLNRQSLRVSGGVKNSNVSVKEKELLNTFEEAKEQQLSVKRNLVAAKHEAKTANGDAQKMIVARGKLKKEEESYASAELSRKEAEVAWNAERDKNEPDVVRKFRAALIRSKSIAQVFDPWFMDVDTHDKMAATPNMQISKNEETHAHHLHITVLDENIL